MSWFHLWLFLHVTAAIVAFGPTFALPLVGALGRDNPMHMSFALRVIGTLERKLIIPFVMTMPVSGVLLAISVSIEWNHNPWLIAALAVYAVALTFALGVQRPVIEKLIEMTSGAGAPAAVPAGPGAAVAGPPPAFLALVKRMQMGGMALTVAFFVIMFLMIWKPGGNI